MGQNATQAPGCRGRRAEPLWSNVACRAGVSSAAAGSRSGRRFVFQVNPEPFGHPIQRPSIDAERFRCARAVAADSLQYVLEVTTLELVERRQVPEHLIFEPPRLAGQRLRKIVHRDASAREHDETLDGVLQLADVS